MLANYSSIREMLNDMSNLTYVLYNQKEDDYAIDFATNIDWFKFKNTQVTRVYGSGNGWIGFGSDSEHLQVNRRDQAMYYLGYEKGTVGVTITYEYFRVYWKGYSSYNTTANKAILEYDCVLLDTGDIYLKIHTFPKVNINGFNRLVAVNTVEFEPSSRPRDTEFTFIHQDDLGNEFELSKGLVEPNYYVVKYLFGDENNKVYTVVDDELSEVTAPLTSVVFKNNGTDTIPSKIVKNLSGLKVYKWSDADTVTMALSVEYIPLPQYVSCVADMNNVPIHGIRSISYDASDDVTVTYSFDGTTWSTEKPLGQLTVDDLSGWSDTKTIYFKFKLSTSTSRLVRFKLIYMN
jgi:hypothetical protein